MFVDLYEGQFLGNFFIEVNELRPIILHVNCVQISNFILHNILNQVVWDYYKCYDIM